MPAAVVAVTPDTDMALYFLPTVSAAVAAKYEAVDQGRRIVFSFSILLLDPGD